MGRFSPSVSPYTGPTIGDAIRESLDRVLARREAEKELAYQHKRQESSDELARALSRAQLYDQGVRFGAPPAEDTNVYAPKLETKDGLADVFARQRIGIGTPAFNPNAPDPRAALKPVPLGAFDKTTGTFNRGEAIGQLPSRYEQLGDGMYVDRTATPSAQRAAALEVQREDARLARSEAHQDRLAEILARGQAGVGGTSLADREAFEGLQQKNRLELERLRQQGLSARAAQRAAGGGAQGPLTRAQLPNATEQKSAGLYRMAKSAAETVDRLEPSIVASQVGRTPVIGNILMGATNPDAQALQQASYQLADAWMRFVSGAAVPEPEVKRYMNMITPQPGDKPEVTRQKQETRRQIIAALEKAGGRAMDDATRSLSVPGTTTGDIDLRQQVPTKPPSGSTLSDADMWEQLVAAGVDKAEATRRVQARHKGVRP